MHSLKKPFSEKITKTLLWRVYLKASFRKIFNTKQLQKLRIFKTMQSLTNLFPLTAEKHCYGDCIKKPLLEIF